ncbi:MAG: flagellar FlbD family protein [Clostridia bacterium]|jgi:flagellar protein FlbD
MIKVTRLNNEEFYINPHLIECIEETPDTVIRMTTGKKFIVAETAEEINEAIFAYYRKIFPGFFAGISKCE